MQYIHCPQCGARLTAKEIGDEGLVPFCESCRCPWFSISTPCVICLLHDGAGSIALIEQTYGTKGFKCVAGYLKAGETAEECVHREISEETGLEVTFLTYLRSWYHDRGDNLMLGFVCKVERGDFALSGEVASARWFTPEEAHAALREGSIAQQLLEAALPSILHKTGDVNS